MLILEAELGRPIASVFTTITERPIASASVGQVYRAELAFDGREVAVKVQRPGVQSKIAVDIFLLRSAVGVLQSLAGMTRDLRYEAGWLLHGRLCV
jgi:predicted unusual protein kinase regulating ubiquinone biosynthesis (AarF/ABC1/UbiB family)